MNKKWTQSICIHTNKCLLTLKMVKVFTKKPKIFCTVLKKKIEYVDCFWTIRDNASSMNLALHLWTLYQWSVRFALEAVQLIVSHVHMVNTDPLTSRLLCCMASSLIKVSSDASPSISTYSSIYIFSPYICIDLFNWTQNLQMRNNVTQVIHHKNFTECTDFILTDFSFLMLTEFLQGLFDLNLWFFLHTILQVPLKLYPKNAVWSLKTWLSMLVFPLPAGLLWWPEACLL